MAEQIPYGVATSLINTLASLAFREIASICGVETEIEWLKETVEGIKAVLADADQKQHTDHLVQLWITNLKQLLLKADDLLDELHTQHLLLKRDGQGKGKGKVRNFFSSSNPIVFRHKIASKIRKIKEQFDAVAETMSKLNLDPRIVVLMHSEGNWRETSSKPEENIIGREESKKEIIDLLLNTDNNIENVSLIAIVGIGGLGKTALAQLVYNDAEVNKFFHKKMWVCASEDFDVKALVKKILESSIGNDVNDQQLELLQNKLEENLNGQRYLLVLDDVWNEDREKWFHLKKYLMCGAKGSKVIVTTRNQTVARCMGIKTPYLLKVLTHERSWDLLKRLTFGQDRIMTQHLESIGRKFVEKCQGVPLAIRVVGSMLQSRIEESDWEAILVDDSWMLSESSNSIMPILKLSYDSLPIELRQCFAYCSLYPKDWKYNKDDLIGLWMAQGYLDSENGNQCLEDVGRQYVHLLLMRTFFQDAEMNEFGEIKYFKMHDLMHDLSQSIAGSECLSYGDRKKIVPNTLHVSFKYDSSCSMDLFNGNSSLRTILDGQRFFGDDLSSLLRFKKLRSLDLSRYQEIRQLPDFIDQLMHLRYLDLSDCHNLTNLPHSISNLVNLQTLKLIRCYRLKVSMDFVMKLVNLRNLHVMECPDFDALPVGLENIHSHPNLKQLTVKLSGGAPSYEFLNWLPSFKNLVELNLFALCCFYLAALEALISLQTLQLRNAANVKYMKYDGCLSSMVKRRTSFFPSLKKLQFIRCPHLVGWEGEADSLPPFPRLSYLSIRDCPNLRCMPRFPSLVEGLVLRKCSLKPLIDTVKVSTTKSSATQEFCPPLSMLKSLSVRDNDIEALPEEWMQNLTSLKHLSVGGSSTATVSFHMKHLPVTLEHFNFWPLNSRVPSPQSSSKLYF